MFTSLENGNKNNQQISWEQRLLKNAGRQKTSLKPEYQELKFTLHRKLLDKINLEALATIDNQRIRGEVRQASSADRADPRCSTRSKNSRSAMRFWTKYSAWAARAAIAGPRYLGHPGQHLPPGLHRKEGFLELTNVTFRDDQHLLRIIDKIVSQVGRRIDESTPMVDARLSDGSRVNAIIPPLAVDSPLLSIRRFRPTS
jgi:pilus assembly protein CpaF